MTLAHRIAEAREAAGKSQQDVANHFGIHRAAVSQWESAKSKPRIERLSKLADFLGVDVSWLSHDIGSPEKSPQPQAKLPPLEDMPRDVPVYGTAQGGLKGSFELNHGDPIDYVRRPPGIARARDVYCIYVEGDSMEPRFAGGELVYVHPGRKIKPGDFVIVEQQISDQKLAVAFIKKLRRRTASKLILEQFNPPSTIEMPIKTVKSVHLILTMNDLFGV
jgi:phage repressor protein C with HTH and peptisase S24 domain